MRNSVVRELDWDREVDDSAIGVAAKDGVVTLTGFIDSYAAGSWAQHDAAERGAGGAPGIGQVDNRIAVVPVEPHEIGPPDELC